MTTTVQNINLYLPEFRRKKFWLDAEKMLLVAGAALVLLVLVSGVEYWQLAQLRGELAVKEQEQREAALATTALLDEYGVQTEDLQLLDEIRALEAGLQSKQALLQFLEGRELGNAEGFSDHLADLSRYHVQGLSLSQISLTAGGRVVELDGQVLKADLVTVFLQNLGQSRTYAGMKVENMAIDEEATTVDSEVGEDAGELVVWNFRVRAQTR